MDAFEYRDGQLYCEDTPVEQLCKEYGTPLYIYSKSAFLNRYREIIDAFGVLDPLICYSVKSNGNLAVLKLLQKAGSGFDVVTGGELHRALSIGADPQSIVYAGVGKRDEEITQAISAGIRMFNVESEAELANINRIAADLGRKAPVALRINPDVVDPTTHAYTSTGSLTKKFGIDLTTAGKILKDASKYPNVSFDGIHCHIGSPILKVEAYEEALNKTVEFMAAHRSDAAPLTHINMGGGFGIRYKDEAAPSPAAYAERIVPIVQKAGAKLIMEPGRYIAGNSGMLAISVQYIKDNGVKKFIITDGGMNDLIRPALYESFHEIWPVSAKTLPPSWNGNDVSGLTKYDVVGPICESGDFYAQDRALPDVVRGDLLSVFSAGAYGHVMSSNYNGRGRPAEIIVDGSTVHLVRRRETYEDLAAFDIVPESL